MSVVFLLVTGPDGIVFQAFSQSFMFEDFGEGETLKDQVVDVMKNHPVGQDMLRGHFAGYSVEFDEEVDRTKMAESYELFIRNIEEDRIFPFKAIPPEDSSE